MDDSLVKKAVCINVADSAQRAACLAQMLTDRAEALQLCTDQRDTRLDTCKPSARIATTRTSTRRSSMIQANPTQPNPYFPSPSATAGTTAPVARPTTCEVVNETADRGDPVHRRPRPSSRATVSSSRPLTTGTRRRRTVPPVLRRGGEGFRGVRTATIPSGLSSSASTGSSAKRPERRQARDHLPRVTRTSATCTSRKPSLGNAEDVTVVLSTTYSYGSGAPELDELVPPDLAALFCSSGHCVVTKNFSLLEPGIFARKYYARGVGVVLEVEPDEAKAIRLVGCNFDPRCAMLAP